MGHHCQGDMIQACDVDAPGYAFIFKSDFNLGEYSEVVGSLSWNIDLIQGFVSCF